MDATTMHHVGPGFIWLVIAILFAGTSLFALGLMWVFDLCVSRIQAKK